MKYRVTLNDGIELLITADTEVDAVRQAKDIKDSLSVSDARDAYAVFLGGGTPYVCFANSEASARKFAEESEGDGSRATKVIKLVKNTRDYDYYVGDPRSVPIADARDAYKEVKDSMNVYDKNFFGEFNGFEAGLFSKLVNNAVSQIEKYPKGSADRKKVADYYLKAYEKRLNEARKQVDEYNNELVAAREELRNGQNMIQKILSTL